VCFYVSCCATRAVPSSFCWITLPRTKGLLSSNFSASIVACASSTFLRIAPQLNPDEGVWSLAKRELANSCPNDVDELMEDILGSIEDIRNSPEKLRGCIAQSELPFSLR